ncbi:hypothetical protein F5146DRAFT_1069854 [Armillaria mellea]|nr:hypothetical protein F5146DRAFT_1069854 [Armillaria mellea]
MSDECPSELPVDQVGWSQDSIAGTFRTGQDIRAASIALRRLSEDERIAVVATYPPIRVVEFETQGWITLDNRRLFLFRAILSPGTPIPVRVATAEEARELIYKLTTKNEGASIVVRANPRGNRRRGRDEH